MYPNLRMRLTLPSTILLGIALLGLGCPPSKAPPPAPVAAQAAAASAPDALTTAAASASTGPASTSEPASLAAAPSASASASAAPVAASAAPTAEPVARPALPTTIGDTTCTKDADCRLTRRLDCCDCCKGNTRATSRAWLSWRDGTLCKQTRCEPCGKVKCAYYEPAEKYAARCEHGSCVLAPR